MHLSASMRMWQNSTRGSACRVEKQQGLYDSRVLVCMLHAGSMLDGTHGMQHLHPSMMHTAHHVAWAWSPSPIAVFVHVMERTLVIWNKSTTYAALWLS